MSELRQRHAPEALARLIDIALEEAAKEAPLLNALDAAVDALGEDAVRHELLRLAAAVRKAA